MDGGRELLSLGVRLLDLVRTGAKTTTYKPATLLAMIDVLAGRAGADGGVPDEIPLRDLGERVLALYWPQVRAYAGLDREAFVLRQIRDRSKGSVILEAVRGLHDAAASIGVRDPDRAALALPREYEAAVTRVTGNLARYPLRLLQVPARKGPDGGYDRLLYDDGVFGGTPPEVLLLHAGIGGRLVALSALLVPALQAEWTLQVADMNALPSEDLRRHLFGRERQDLTPLRELLRGLQDRTCLYCRRALRTGGHVDHVVPWSLHPQDALENLVLAHDACNLGKSAHLLDREPLAAWAARDLGALAEAAATVGWRSRPAVVFSTARAAYAHAAAAQVWSADRGVRPLEPGEARESFLPLLQVA